MMSAELIIADIVLPTLIGIASMIFVGSAGIALWIDRQGNQMSTGPYRADVWHNSLVEDIRDMHRWNVVGPHIAGGWHGTVPHSHAGMIQEDARYLAELLNLAFHAGKTEAQREMRQAMGLKHPPYPS